MNKNKHQFFEIEENNILKANYNKIRTYFEKKSKDGILYIPKEIDGVIIKKVDLNLVGINFIKEIIFADDSEVEEICRRCFFSLGGLERVILPKELKKIDHNNFTLCHKIITLELPDSLEWIGVCCFIQCYNWEWSQKLPKNLKLIGSSAFKHCHKIKGTLIIPDKVEVLGSQCFGATKEVKEILLGKNIKKIGWAVFDGCCLTKNLIIPESTKIISNGAFERLEFKGGKIINNSKCKESSERYYFFKDEEKMKKWLNS
ncbi:MAG: leucine-rich repeat domain-containing protein [Mycoplasma sp.]